MTFMENRCERVIAASKTSLDRSLVGHAELSEILEFDEAFR